MADEKPVVPTFGYTAEGRAAIFDLETADAELPTGWSRDPNVIADEAGRTAEAISARGVERNPGPVEAPKVARTKAQA